MIGIFEKMITYYYIKSNIENNHTRFDDTTRPLRAVLEHLNRIVPN